MANFDATDTICGVLNSFDTEEMYAPIDFDRVGELERVHKFSALVKSISGLRADVASPSLFQDGPLFTKILLFNKSTADLPGQILFSSFGRLVTVLDMSSPDLVLMTSNICSESDYYFIHGRILSEGYSGGHIKFNGLSWMERYFSDFYNLLKMRNISLE